MKDFPAEIGKLGFVFNFITYGGHQIDGLASEEFSRALLEDGALALARLQRKLGYIHLAKKDFEVAKRRANEAIEVFKQLNDLEQLLYSLEFLSRVQNATENYKEAINKYHETLLIARN